jgi:hypothetical protein
VLKKRKDAGEPRWIGGEVWLCSLLGCVAKIFKLIKTICNSCKNNLFLDKTGVPFTCFTFVQL